MICKRLCKDINYYQLSNYKSDKFSFSFLPQKRETEKARRICNDAKSQRLRALKFLCVSESLRLCVFNFLTLFLQGGRDFH